VGPDDDHESSRFLSSGDVVYEMALYEYFGVSVHTQDKIPAQAVNAALVCGMITHQMIQKIVSQKWERSALDQC